MFDYISHFNKYCKDHALELSLSFNMPAGYETAYGTFDVALKTVFINAAVLNDAPDCEKAFYLFHELRHASQYLRPGLFGRAVNRSLGYVIMYDGACYKLVDGEYLECRLEGGEDYFTNIYLGQPYEVDANTFAYQQVRELCGDSEELRKLYEFWIPRQSVPDEVYDSVYDQIDEMTNKKRILVTAFEPFGGETINPAARILEALPEEIGGCKLHKLLLPVEFFRCREIAAAEYDKIKPAAVIMLGQHGGADAINVETAAVNRMHAIAPDGSPRPDNAGFAPANEPLIEGGADRLFSTFPAEEIARAISAAGVRCELSHDAGRYVCNALLYGLLCHDRGEVPTGFLHVPYLKEQGHEDKPYMELDAMVRGIAAAVRATAAGIG